MSVQHRPAESFDFCFMLCEHGWSQCWIILNKLVYEMTLSHVLNNPLEVLLDSLILLIEGKTEVNFTWNDEPGTYHWILRREHSIPQELSISIQNVLEMSGKESKSVSLNFTVAWREFCVIVSYQMRKIRDLMTDANFKKNRRGAFPHKMFEDFERSSLSSNAIK
jgi:hypothetical protein